MSCSGSHLGITINIKNTKFVKDLPMIDAQQSHILRGSKEVGVTIESYGKVEISYINVDNF
jgi:hypothetical protein